MKTLPILAAAAASVAFEPAVADTAKPLSYEQFETSVAHLDLDDCPGHLAKEDTFCRLAIGGDALHVFVFSNDGEQPLVGFESFGSGQYEILLSE